MASESRKPPKLTTPLQPTSTESTRPLEKVVHEKVQSNQPTDEIPPSLVAKITEQVIASLASLKGEMGQVNLSPTQSISNPIPIPTTSPAQASVTLPLNFHEPFTQPIPKAPSPQSISEYNGYNGYTGYTGNIPGEQQSDSRKPSNTYQPPMLSTADDSDSDSDHSISPYNNPTPTESPSRTRENSTIKENVELRGRNPGEKSRQGSQAERPATQRRVSNDDDETVIEKMWKPLFENGNPTPRLNQFLRGIALHLVEEYEPKHNLVVGPQKMRKFYNQMKAREEEFPFDTIFNLPHEKLSSVYSQLSCHHHLVPYSKAPYERPTLPALTPNGFATFVTLFIQASPDSEFDRLSSTVREWPVCNADERKDRWPKELSRRLLPAAGAMHVKKQINEVLIRAGITLKHSAASRNSNSESGPLPSHFDYSQSAPTTYPSSRGQKENLTKSTNRSPPVDSPRDNTSNYSISSEDDEPFKSNTSIERERKPFTAAPGSGKIYNDSGDLYRSRSQGPSSSTSSRSIPIPSKSSFSSKNNDMPPRSPRDIPSRSRRYSTASRRSNPAHSPPPFNGSGFSVEGPPFAPQTGHYYGNPISSSASSFGHTPPTAASAHVGVGHGQDDSMESRYAQYDVEYRQSRSAGYSGNSQLGTGERRYG